MKNVFLESDVNDFIARINRLQSTTTPQWGKMNAAQMLAHCCVTYEFVYDNKHAKPGAIARFFIRLFARDMVVGNKPYPRNSRTAKVFLVPANQDFGEQKARLAAYMKQTQQLGEKYFDGKESLSFGKLGKKEWNNMFAKHLDHHLSQFGV